MNNRTAMNKKANAILKKKFIDMGKTSCEICGSNYALTFMHRLKRRHYTSLNALSDMNEVILACIKCHTKYEYDRKATEELFKRLR